MQNLPKPLWALLGLWLFVALGVVAAQDGKDRFEDLRPARPGASRWTGPKPAAPKPEESEPPTAPKAPQPEQGSSEASPTTALPVPSPAEPTALQPLVQQPNATESKWHKVAEMDWTVGSRPSLVVHGTLPVPPEFRLLGPGRTPLAIRPRGLTTDPIPAQVTLVTRTSTGAPSVVELGARVEMPPQIQHGSHHRFEVFWGDFACATEPLLPTGAKTLFATPDGPFLRTEDVFGNRYRFAITQDPAGFGVTQINTLQIGPSCHQWKVSGVLMPEGSPSALGAPLPHMMGVSAYVTQWGGSSHTSLDLRIHNGLTAGSHPRTAMDSPLGSVYWKSIDLYLPLGWTSEVSIADPFLGAEAEVENGWKVRSLVKALPGGKLHLMGPQAQMVRRLTLRRTQHSPCARVGAFVEGLMFCQPGLGLWSWFSLPAYFPQMALLPTLEHWKSDGRQGANAVEARLAAERDRNLQFLRSGDKDGNLIYGGVMGWSHPRGYPHGGAVSGVDIGFVEGHLAAWAASQAGYEDLEFLHRMTVARQPDAQYTALGEPVGVQGWRDANGVVPFDFRTNGYMVPPEFQFVCKGGPAPSEQVREVLRRNLRPPYDIGTAHDPKGELPRATEALFAWMPHDDQHMIRHTKNLKALVWLGNDPLAKDDLMHASSLFRLMFSEGPHTPVSWSAGVTLRAFLAWAASAPHHGLPVDRAHAWGIDMMCASYQCASDAWRADALPWFQKVVELFDVASMPSGLIQRYLQPDLLDAKYDACQTFQLMFLLHSQRCLIESVFRDVDPDRMDTLARLHNRGLDFLFFGHIYTHFQGERWGGFVSSAGPYHRFAVAPKGPLTEVPYCFEDVWGKDYLPPGGFGEYVDTTYLFPPLEYGYLLTRNSTPNPLDNRYLQRSLVCGSLPGSWNKLDQEFWQSVQYGFSDNSQNLASYIAQLQRLGAVQR